MIARTYRVTMVSVRSLVPVITIPMDRMEIEHASNVKEVAKKSARLAKLIAYQMHNTIADVHISKVH